MVRRGGLGSLPCAVPLGIEPIRTRLRDGPDADRKRRKHRMGYRHGLIVIWCGQFLTNFGRSATCLWGRFLFWRPTLPFSCQPLALDVACFLDRMAGNCKGAFVKSAAAGKFVDARAATGSCLPQTQSPQNEPLRVAGAVGITPFLAALERMTSEGSTRGNFVKAGCIPS